MCKGQTKLKAEERVIVEKLNDRLYTVGYIEEWINRHDDVGVDPVSALQSMGAKGFYQAVRLLARSGYGG